MTHYIDPYDTHMYQKKSIDKQEKQMAKHLERTDKMMSIKLVMVQGAHQMLVFSRHCDLASLDLGQHLKNVTSLRLEQQLHSY